MKEISATEFVRNAWFAIAYSTEVASKPLARTVFSRKAVIYRTADGVPVVLNPGTPNTRLLFDPWIEDARAKGIRLISYDRPGYGGSTRHEGHTVADGAGDVATIPDIGSRWRPVRAFAPVSTAIFSEAGRRSAKLHVTAT